MLIIAKYTTDSEDAGCPLAF